MFETGWTLSDYFYSVIIVLHSGHLKLMILGEAG